MKKALMRAVAGVSVLAMLMTGCSGATSGSTGGQTSGTSGTSGSGTGGSSGVELTYWSMWNSTEGQAKVLQEAADAYEKETGVKINIEWKGRDVKTLIGPALDAGEKIDMFDQDYMFILQQCEKYITDLTDMNAASGYESHALPVLLEKAKSEASDGKLKVIPYQPYTSGVWYNKDMFEKAGITEVPKTFEELLAVCEKLKASGVNPMTCDAGDGTGLLMGYQLARYMGQDKLIEMVDNASWADSPEALKAAQDISSLFTKEYMSPNAPDAYPNGQNEIGYGESAMILQCSWIPNEISQNTQADVNWGFFPWPSVPNGVDGTEGAVVGSQAFAIVDKSEHKQEAYDFIMSVVTGEYDLKMAEAVSSIPADTANTKWPDAVAGAEPYFKDTTKAYEWAAGLQNNSDYKDYIQDAINRLCSKELDPKGFIAELSKLK